MVRRKIILHATAIIKKSRKPSKIQYQKRVKTLSSTIGSLKHNLQLTEEKIKSQAAEIIDLKTQLKEEQKFELEKLRLQGVTEYLRAKEFKYCNLKKRKIIFEYLCGLSLEQFNLVLIVLHHYVHLIPYPDCPNTGEKQIDMELSYFMS